MNAIICYLSRRFREAATSVNGLPVEKLPLLLNRIIEKLHLRVPDMSFFMHSLLLLLCGIFVGLYF